MLGGCSNFMITWRTHRSLSPRVPFRVPSRRQNRQRAANGGQCWANRLAVKWKRRQELAENTTPTLSASLRSGARRRLSTVATQSVADVEQPEMFELR